MLEPESLSERTWSEKFRDAFRGIKAGVRGQSSFFVHFFMTAAVLAAAFMLQLQFVEWCLLLICVTVVLTAEMFNSALESMAKAVTGESDPHLGASLDVAAGAVLMAALGASVVGLLIFARRAIEMSGY